MKKVLIIGVSGFIGRELFNSLKGDFFVYGISRSAVDLPNCEKVDVSAKNQIKNYLNKNSFDVVINLASILANSDNLKDTAVLQDNIVLTINLIEALIQHKGIHLINFSSSSVYANTSGTYAEEGLIDPSKNSDCIYGLSKFNAEMLFKYILKEVELTNLRIPMVYGDHMNESRIHKTFEKELQEKNTISVWGNGERIITHISINELCEQVRQIIVNKIIGTYNTVGESISLLQLANRIIAAKGNNDSKVELINKGSKSKFKLDGTLLKQKLNG